MSKRYQTLADLFERAIEQVYPELKASMHLELAWSAAIDVDDLIEAESSMEASTDAD